MKEGTEQIDERIYRLNFVFVSMFLVIGDSGPVGIDAGFSSSGVRRGFSECRIDPESVAAVFLTHSDHDHAG
jgi:glyoxylase-like metal-dependent hydrolase (beta-lactamase superfamily II)